MVLEIKLLSSEKDKLKSFYSPSPPPPAPQSVTKVAREFLVYQMELIKIDIKDCLR